MRIGNNQPFKPSIRVQKPAKPAKPNLDNKKK